MATTGRLISMHMQSQALHTQQIAAEAAAEAAAVGVALHPNDVELNRQMEMAVLDIQQIGRPTNTSEAMDPKVMEYFQFCDHVCESDNYKCVLVYEKIHRFMWHQSFRERKKSDAEVRAARKRGEYFNVAEYNEVIAAFNA
jgi:hypothetical protein